MPADTMNARFKARLAAREPLLGTFLKTPHPILVEVLAAAGFDFIVIDGEHGPFDRGAIDTLMIACRAVGLPAIVRVPADHWIGWVLDMGAAGVMVPHVASLDRARAVVAACRYPPEGARGFAGTTRAAGYVGRAMAEQLTHPGDEVVLLCQIEEPEGVAAAAEIAALDGVDGLFVGRADLSVASGERAFAGPRTVAETCEVLGRAGAANGLYCAPGEDLAPFREAGATVFVVGSEHTLIAGGGRALRAAFDEVKPG